MRYYSTDPGDGMGDVVRIHDDGSVEVYAPESTVERRKGRWFRPDPSRDDYEWEIEQNRDGEWRPIKTAADLKRILAAQDRWNSEFDAEWLEQHPT